MAELHTRWRDLPGTTDVMSCPMDEPRPGGPDRPSEPGTLRAVISCPQAAARQAEQGGHGGRAALDPLSTHGILHPRGHAHAEPEERTELFGLQTELLMGWRPSAAAASRTAETRED